MGRTEKFPTPTEPRPLLICAASVEVTQVPWWFAAPSIGGVPVVERGGRTRPAKSGVVAMTPVSRTATIVAALPVEKSQAAGRPIFVACQATGKSGSLGMSAAWAVDAQQATARMETTLHVIDAPSEETVHSTPEKGEGIRKTNGSE